MIRVILWDIDNTLLDFYAAERRSIKACFKAFGLGPCTDEMVARYSAINIEMWKWLEDGLIEKPALLTGRFGRFFEAEGIAFDRLEEINALYQKELGETIVVIEDSIALVEELRGRVKQYAVTNGTFVAQDRKLKKSGLDKLLDGVFISEEVGAEKPSPAFFNKVFETIGDYAKDEILIVGDSLTSDMRGGSWAGIRCCWFNPAGDPIPPELNIRYDIRHLAQVKEILDEG